MPRPKRHLLLLCVAIIGIGLLTYSQLVAYWGDESLHLVAAQLINAGRRPYLDFFYQHTPWFVYVAAAFIPPFGESWRVIHAFCALLTTGSVLGVGMYTQARAKNFAGDRWPAIIAVVLLGLNAYVISFGTVALPYGLCLCMMVVSFCFATESVHESSERFAFAAGASAGTAAMAYLLTAPLLLVIFLWLLAHSASGRRLRHTAWYCAGATVPCLLLLWLAVLSPHQVWHDLIEYHLFHRAGRDLDLWFNLREIAGWFVSIQGTMLVSLAAFGLVATRRNQLVDVRLKRDLILSICIALSLSLFISVSRPVSSFYYVLITPFVAIPAAFGIFELSSRIHVRRSLACLILVLLYVAGLSAERYIWRRQTSYADHRAVRSIAQIVDEVTPPAGMIYAFESVYFAAHRLPPPGLENRFNPDSKANVWLAEGRFDTVCIGATDRRVRELGLLERYRKIQTVTMDGYEFYILWDKSESAEKPQSKD